MLKSLLTFGIAVGFVIVSPTMFSWASSLTVPAGTPAPTHVAVIVQHTGGNPAPAAPPSVIATNPNPASVSCGPGTTLVMFGHDSVCKVTHPSGNVNCPSGSVLVHNPGKPELCASDLSGGSDSHHHAGHGQLPPPTIQFNANLDTQTTTDGNQFDGSADVTSSGDTQSQDAVESPQDPTQLGNPTCPDGYTLITMGGKPTCKGATHIACDKEGARHLMPDNAVNKQWDPRACHWNYQLAN